MSEGTKQERQKEKTFQVNDSAKTNSRSIEKCVWQDQEDFRREMIGCSFKKVNRHIVQIWLKTF